MQAARGVQCRRRDAGQQSVVVAALQALPDGAVKGKIVFFAGRTERTRDGSGYGGALVWG